MQSIAKTNGGPVTTTTLSCMDLTGYDLFCYG